MIQVPKCVWLLGWKFKQWTMHSKIVVYSLFKPEFSPSNDILSPFKVKWVSKQSIISTSRRRGFLATWLMLSPLSYIPSPFFCFVSTNSWGKYLIPLLLHHVSHSFAFLLFTAGYGTYHEFAFSTEDKHTCHWWNFQVTFVWSKQTGVTQQIREM